MNLFKDWAIFCCPKSEKNYVCIARFYNRQDADAHLKFLRKCVPTADFQLVFDRPVEPFPVFNQPVEV